ncbi:MAG: mechanosensitive ion channel family protein, partial [Methanobacteriota archaeon]
MIPRRTGQRARRRAAVAVLFALAGAPLVAGQASDTFVVESPLATEARLRPDATETFTWSVANHHPTAELLVAVTISGAGPAYDARSLPARTTLEPGESAEVAVEVRRLPDVAAGRAEIAVAFLAVNSSLDLLVANETVLVVEPRGTDRVLGILPNPLPPPLDGAYGVVLLDIVVWGLVALVVLPFLAGVVGRLTAGASRRVNREIVGKMRTPVFLAIVLWGLRDAVLELPHPAFVGPTVTLLSVALFVSVLLVLYRVADSLLYYYSEQVAGRTETKLDDVLIPILRKVAVVVVVLAGIFYALETFGVDLTVFVAGGVVVSMVLAFAAQDTLSNFFSGVYLMLDQPFNEGEDIELETGEVCRVDHVGLRSTRLYHYRRHQLIVLPNNLLASRRVVNLHRPDLTYRVQIDVGVAYGSDPDEVREAMLRAIRGHASVREDEAHPIVVQL